MEMEYGTRRDRLGKCKAAREFVLRIVPELAYFFGLASQVVRASADDRYVGSYLLLCVEALGPCIREGFDCPEKLALRWVRQRRLSRVAVHREFSELSGLLDVAAKAEDFAGLRRRVRNAVEAFEKGGG